MMVALAVVDYTRMKLILLRSWRRAPMLGLAMKATGMVLVTGVPQWLREPLELRWQNHLRSDLRQGPRVGLLFRPSEVLALRTVPAQGGCVSPRHSVIPRLLFCALMNWRLLFCGKLTLKFARTWQVLPYRTAWM